MRNISYKVAIGTTLPCKPGALHHGNPIAAGYVRVTVDDVLEGLGAKATDPEESPNKSNPLRWWWSTYTSFTSADVDAAPQSTAGG
ncbi:hypothetical protein QYE76_049592 [Lolium multiflorum]|uniref:DUF8039 domain-containing protein n=1 Tax=Lolium multiflorum TaxID=4521 RepID=A0AAD8WIH2_LOLMU|nr:hypothetical protein QYE76_049592 [Lolium multiflorum]